MSLLRRGTETKMKKNSYIWFHLKSRKDPPPKKKKQKNKQTIIGKRVIATQVFSTL